MQQQIDMFDSRSSARSVEVMCRDLAEAGPSAYLVYRGLSWFSHPSAMAAEKYVTVDSTGEINGFRQVAEDWDPRLTLFPLCSALIWAGRAADTTDPKRTRRAQLIAAAKALEVPDHMTVSDTAWVRLNAPDS